MHDPISNDDLRRVIGGTTAKLTLDGDVSTLRYSRRPDGPLSKRFWGLVATIPNSGAAGCPSARDGMYHALGDAASFRVSFEDAVHAANRAAIACNGKVETY
jgi:hypothetical protein